MCTPEPLTAPAAVCPVAPAAARPVGSRGGPARGPVTTDAWRPYWRQLGVVFGLSAFVVVGRGVCLFAQGCRWVVPLDVEGMRAAQGPQPAGRHSRDASLPSA